MNNIKKLLIYPLAFVLFFGLTANECLDAVEDLKVDVPTTIVENYELVITEEGSFEQIDVIDLSSPEVQEYRDRLENFTINDFTITIVDNIDGGSSEANVFAFYVGLDGERNPVAGGNNTSIRAILERLTVDDLGSFKTDMERVLLDVEDPKIDLIFGGVAQGPVDYSITVTIDGVLEASTN